MRFQRKEHVAMPILDPTLDMEMKHRKGAVRGRECRNHSLNTKLTAAEAAAVNAAAESEGKAVGEWLRDLALGELDRGRRQLHSLAVMGEIAALRLLLINTLEPLVRGDKMTADQFKEMLRYVKANKRKAAEDALTSYAERCTEQV
jgi:hypothetical protein